MMKSLTRWILEHFEVLSNIFVFIIIFLVGFACVLFIEMNSNHRVLYTVCWSGPEVSKTCETSTAVDGDQYCVKFNNKTVCGNYTLTETILNK